MLNWIKGIDGDNQGSELRSISPASTYKTSRGSSPISLTGTLREDEEILLPNDYKYYHNHLDKNQFNLTLINCSIYLIKLLYLNDSDVEINSPNLRFFILQILKRSKTSIQILQIASFYLLKLVKNQNLTIVKNPKHLFVGLVILASKFNQDANYSFKTWVKILGLNAEDKSQISFLKNLEINLLKELDYKLYVDNTTYENWCNVLLIFGYDFIKVQKILLSYSKSEVEWEIESSVINNKLSKWGVFFNNLNLTNLSNVEIKFMNYYLNQFNSKIFFINSLFDKRKLDDYDNDNEKTKISCK